MKRSEINRILLDAKEFMKEKGFVLPPWAYWTVNDWKENLIGTDEIRNNFLGWDITDFGSGDFKTRGLFLFTIRNGKLGVDLKTYAEKIMIVEENQETPMHFHWSKMEDIINRVKVLRWTRACTIGFMGRQEKEKCWLAKSAPSTMMLPTTVFLKISAAFR
ncbi:MAG: D-lyxose/D-mannose family sugar isomerase [Prolixibacteraceae bacterium]|jgi:hypothetical protein|nr:D-lyxose/D-mannose family sugar isomerase [Prolixibacteraceae bacterium]